MGKVSNSLVDTIISAISKLIEEANYDRTHTCRISEVVGGGKYKVLKNGKEYTVLSKYTYSVGDTVLVLLPQNKWNSAIIIYPQTAI